MSAPPPAPDIQFAPRAVDIAGIERALHLLVGETDDANPDAPQHITRVCMSNLMIFVASKEAAGKVPDEIDTVVQSHPARALLLIGDEQQALSDIAAQVSAHCHTAGSGRRVCSEHVSVSATGAAVRRLPSTARSLLIGDLPTALWWASPTPPPLGGPLFDELSAMAGQVIYESLGWLDPVHQMIATADWAARDPGGQVIADLSWRRLKPWRRIITQGLDPTVVPQAQQSITDVYMEHGPHGLPQAWLLVSWLARRLGWQPTQGKVKGGTEVTWGFLSPRNPVKVTIRRLPTGDPVVTRMSIGWLVGGKGMTAHFALEPDRLVVTWDDKNLAPRHLIAPPQTRAELVAKQLPDLGSDILFRNTLQVCKHMAEALL